ncbi:MAG: VOC family protein [Flavobacteriaceae bacterium]|nr:VOC family protein [Flavobacteriaceae bacterium]
MKLKSFTLQIFEPEKTIDFYTKVLGFSLLKTYSNRDSTYYNLGYSNANYYIQLKHTPSLAKENYQQHPNDNYWKYSVFVNNIQKVYANLLAKGHAIKEPFQFGNIGYLAHTIDTENHQIEFIQKTFKGNPTKNINPTNVLGLLTIRTKDPLKSIRFYENVLNLKLFVRMYVGRGKGFTLYFLGDKNLQAPNLDIDAIENREWMYQQEHLFIEIQYYWGSERDDSFNLAKVKNTGLQHINFGNNGTVPKEPFVFETPDQHTILLKKEQN